LGVFPYTVIIPGEDNIFVASGSELPEKYVLKSRYARIADKSLFISKDFIDYAFDPQKLEWLKSEIGKYFKAAPVNRDFYPMAMTASIIWWQSVFAPNVTSVYAFIIKYFWFLYLLPVAWLLTGRSGAPGTAFSSGFCAMGLQMASIWGLQVSNGNVYQLIGALNALFMAGAALGAAGTRIHPALRVVQGSPEPHVVQGRIANYKNPILLTEIFFLAWIALWAGLFFLPLKSVFVFFALSAGTGLLLGYQFPLLTGGRDGSSSAGVIFSFDLFGGWLAALLAGTVLIPAGGFFAAVSFLLLTKAVSSLWWAKNK